MKLTGQRVVCSAGVLPCIIIAGLPTVACAHTGLEPRLGHVMLIGIAAGIVFGAVCMVCRFWLPKALLLLFAFVFIAILVVSLFLPDVPFSDIFWELFSVVISCAIPVSFGAVVVSFSVKAISGVIKKWRRKP